MTRAFIIMQIGDPKMERVCAEVIVPALVTCGLEPRRVERDQTGLLRSSTAQRIKEADIIVADLTNDRPYCFLEVGFAMGLGKQSNLVLAARQDYDPARPGRTMTDPRLPFDLAGYDVLFWDPGNLPAYKTELVRRIRTLRASRSGAESSDGEWDEKWFRSCEEAVSRRNHAGAMEVRAAVVQGGPIDVSARRIRSAVSGSAIREFVLPFAAYYGQGPNAPVDGGDTVLAKIEERDPDLWGGWAVRRTGELYAVEMLVEDAVAKLKGTLPFDVRIQKVAEALLFLERLYSRLGTPATAVLRVRIRHVGLGRRRLGARDVESGVYKGAAKEDAHETTLTLVLDRIRVDLTRHVKQVLAPVFVLFDGTVVSDEAFERFVGEFASRVGGSAETEEPEEA